jgi:ATP-dependent exoDNAse (exonuclease V) beta subunit
MDFDGATEFSIKPGLHQPETGSHSVVWWDPALLRLQVQPSFGLRSEEILTEDAQGHSIESAALYDRWKSHRETSLVAGTPPTLNVFLATDGTEPPPGYVERVQVERVRREGARPKGPRFGSLVHLILSELEFTASPDTIQRIAKTHGRLLNATNEEVDTATQAVVRSLDHPLLLRARQAPRLYRELPIVFSDGNKMVETVLDLAFAEETGWIVVDFKTELEDAQRLNLYRRQVGWYIHAVEQTSGKHATGYVLYL